jgi:hypothetical protein
MATALSFARATTTTTVQQMITSCSSLAAAAEESGDSRGCLMTLIPQVARSGIVEKKLWFGCFFFSDPLAVTVVAR